MPSFDRHLANAAILVSLGRLLLLPLLLPLPLPLLHNTHAHAHVAAAPPAPYPSPLQGQRTHTSCMMRRGEHTGDSPLGKGAENTRKAKSQSDQLLTSLEPRPKPLMTFPSICSGNGDSGPDAGPTTRGLVFAMAAWLLFRLALCSVIAWIARSGG